MKRILLRPIITEKTTRLTDRHAQKQYGFIVAKDCNKIEIRNAIEKTYGVSVEKIRTAITAPRVRRRYTKTGILEGKSPNYKKAYVTLAPDQSIDLYENSPNESEE